MPKKKLEDTEITGALAENRMEDGRRRIKLTGDQRVELLDRQQAEAAAAMFLDLEEAHKWPQIADELGISVHQLKELVKTPLFDEVYNAMFAELGHDPRYKAAQGALTNMLPAAMRTLQDLMLNTRTPATVRLRAVEKIIDLVGLEAVPADEYNRKALIELLQGARINVEELNIGVPAEYATAQERYLHPQTIDGEVRDIPDPEEESEEDLETAE